MSLTDRNRAPAPPAYPVAPAEPTATPPKSNRNLWILAIGLFTLAIVLGVVAYTAGRTPASGAPATGPASAGVPSTAPTPTPTLSERDQAAAAASNGFKAYIAAYDKVTRGANALPKDLAATVTGPQAKYILSDLKSAKASGFVRSGSAIAYTRVDALSELSEKTPTAKLATCVDQTGVTVTKNGKPYEGKPQYIRGQFVMHRVGGVWKVYNGTSEIWKGGDCLAALGPTAR